MLKSNAANEKQLDDINGQIAVLEKQLKAQESTLQNNSTALTEQSSALEIQVAQIEDQLKKVLSAVLSTEPYSPNMPKPENWQIQENLFSKLPTSKICISEHILLLFNCPKSK